MSDILKKIKDKAAKIPLWGWAAIGGGTLLLMGGSAVAAYEYLGWDENQVRQWIRDAAWALYNAGYDTSGIDEDDMVIIAKGESSGNPNAIQGKDVVDVNTESGDLAKGLFQTISATFNTYRLPSLPNNIFDPVANGAASMRYILHRYKSSANVPGVKAVKSGDAYVGY